MSFAIVERETGEIVHTVRSTKSGGQRQRVFDGLGRNLDAFWAAVTEASSAAAKPQERGRLSGLAE